MVVLIRPGFPPRRPWITIGKDEPDGQRLSPKRLAHVLKIIKSERQPCRIVRPSLRFALPPRCPPHFAPPVALADPHLGVRKRA
jgi:hypothetical protein